MSDDAEKPASHLFQPGADPRRGLGARDPSNELRQLRALFRSEGEPTFRKMIELRDDVKVSAKVRLDAMVYIMNRILGMPKSVITTDDVTASALRGDSDLLAKFERLLADQRREKDALTAQAPEPEGGGNGTNGNGVH